MTSAINKEHRPTILRLTNYNLASPFGCGEGEFINSDVDAWFGVCHVTFFHFQLFYAEAHR